MKSGARQARLRHVRHRILQLGLALGIASIAARAVQLQVIQRDYWQARALAQHEDRVSTLAPRGAIYDREGRPLAASRTTYTLGVAPKELRDRREAARLLVRELSLRGSLARDISEARRAWLTIPGKHSAVVKQELEARVGTAGLYFTPVVERFYPRGELGREILGRVDAGGRGASGLELSLDSLLTGQPGFSMRRRDATGASAGWLETPVVQPTAGIDVHLTIDSELQALGETVLEEAIAETGAQGGDLIIVEPASGELLAMVSRRAAGSFHLAAVTEPYEPGSTLKPFTAAALLSEELARLDDSVDTGLGEYRTAGRTIHDERAFGRLTFAEVLERSSNVGMAMFAERLESGTQYSYLRGFGFGTPTGIIYPSESAGTLRSPSLWSRQSSASLAIGYEISVTPLQLAMAYAAIANGGELMSPRLVLRTSTREGATRWATEPQVLRRVVTENIASQLRDVLAHAVTQGTGRTAGVRGLSVAGKTGTALRFSAVSGYSGESYTASFVGLVPSDDPELVVLVKLDGPSGPYYGGETAAPVVRTAVRAALAGSHWSAPPLLGEPDYADQKAGVSAGRASAGGPFVFALDEPLRRADVVGDFERGGNAAIPNLRGSSIRVAAHRLHEEGWRVVVQGGGRVVSMRPGAGSKLRLGEVVHLVGGERSPAGRAGGRQEE